MTFGKMLNTFSFWLSSNLRKKNSGNYRHIFYWNDYSDNIISAVGLFCFDKFEDNQNEKVFNIFPNVIVNLTLRYHCIEICYFW